jgi:hypothetical protein
MRCWARWRRAISASTSPIPTALSRHRQRGAAGRRGPVGVGRKYQVGNVGVTILAERPKLAPHMPAMQNRLATLLGWRRTRSASGEDYGGVGCDGAGEAIGALAVATLTPRPRRAVRRTVARRRLPPTAAAAVTSAGAPRLPIVRRLMQ